MSCGRVSVRGACRGRACAYIAELVEGDEAGGEADVVEEGVRGDLAVGADGVPEVVEGEDDLRARG